MTVRQDWAAGRVTGDGATQVGTIRLDVRHMKVPPLTVDLGKGSAWRGFVAMLQLGANHILTGTDHLLFLLILLLPAPLLAAGGRWNGGLAGPERHSRASAASPSPSPSATRSRWPPAP
ncbi:HupE/UreJ family protein [Streptomyces sp. L7]